MLLLILFLNHFFRYMNGFIPSYFSSFSQPNLFGRLGNATTATAPNGQVPMPKGNQMATHLNGHGGHRRLPATPNKPSTLFTQTASMAFHNFSHQFTKPSSLTFRPPGNFFKNNQLFVYYFSL